MLIPQITHMEALQRGLRVMDATALTLCMENEPADPRLQHGRRAQHRADSVRRTGGNAGDNEMSELIDELLADARERMGKSVEATNHEFGSVRTGRASPALLDRIVVDYYGAPTPLKQLATINAPEARLLTVQPYDKSSIKAIEKAIMESDLGLTPNNDGKHHPAVDPRAHRGAPPRARQDGAPHRRGGPRRRSATCAATSCTTSASSRTRATSAPTTSTAARSSCRSSPTRKHRRARRAPEGQGRRDPRGLMAGGARYVAIITDGNGRWAQAARPAGRRGPPGRRRHRQGAPARRRRARRSRS